MLLSTFSGKILEAGVDEAGRGCLAGPVVAAAVILPPGYKHNLLNDSKQLNKKQRELIREVVLQDAVCWAIGEASPAEIDEINILQATFLAMHRAVAGLAQQAEHLIVDGNCFKPYGEVPHTCIVKGDGKYLAIAAASILAKTHRDMVMEKLAEEYGMYGWERNAGYPTVEHRKALALNGTTPHHRLSFTLLPASEPTLV